MRRRRESGGDEEEEMRRRRRRVWRRFLAIAKPVVLDNFFKINT